MYVPLYFLIRALGTSAVIAKADIWHNLTSADLGTSERVNNSCCSILQARLGEGTVAYPGSADFQSQQDGINGYWTQQAAAVVPTCRVSPRDAKEVAVAVANLARHSCSFAVRGGGHMSWAGAANIDHGITIDLSALRGISVSQDRRITSVGGGTRWKDVYMKLDSMGLSVTGGRVAEVGVGGLITGGGNSFFGPRFGFACDNVENFQVVLGSGRIVHANTRSHRDLYRALKGGSNNFGIVTRFDLATFEHAKMWGGFVAYPINSSTEHFQSLEDFTTASGKGVDPHAMIINAYVFTGTGPTVIVNTYTSTKAEAFPDILRNFTEIRPQLSNTLRTTNLTDITIEVGAGTPNGFRQLFGTATFANDATLFRHLYDLAAKAFAPLQRMEKFQASFVLQPIPTSITEKGIFKGGNSLGLGCEDGNLVWLDLTIQWARADDDAVIEAAIKTLLDEGIKYAQGQGLYHRFLYLNYATRWQDPIASYGQDNVRNLRAVSRQYDPGRVFQHLVPGGFKLHRRHETSP